MAFETRYSVYDDKNIIQGVFRQKQAAKQSAINDMQAWRALRLAEGWTVEPPVESNQGDHLFLTLSSGTPDSMDWVYQYKIRPINWEV